MDDRAGRSEAQANIRDWEAFYGGMIGIILAIGFPVSDGILRSPEFAELALLDRLGIELAMVMASIAVLQISVRRRIDNEENDYAMRYWNAHRRWPASRLKRRILR